MIVDVITSPNDYNWLRVGKDYVCVLIKLFKTGQWKEEKNFVMFLKALQFYKH